MTINRRSFLKQGSSLAAAAASPWLLNLAAIGEASAQTAQDYKALVCIFLTGGNDQSNTLIPLTQFHYDRYAEQRPQFCLQRSALLYGHGTGITPTPIPQVPIPKDLGYPGLDDFPDLAPADQLPLQTMPANPAAHNWYGLAPSLSSLFPLYQEGVLAPVLNVGSLVEPTVGHELDAAGAVKLVKHADITQAASVPPKLGSHNDQQMYWQALRAEGAQQGWGGLMLNFVSPANASHDVESMFAAGSPVWSQGASTTAPYPISLGESLVTPFDAYDGLYGGTNVAGTIQNIMSGMPGTGVGQRDYNRLNKLRRDLMELSEKAFSLRSQLGSASFDRSPTDPVYDALSALAESSASNLPRDQNRLASQLRAVAHAIRMTRQLPSAPRRQVFFVTLDGFDTHSKTIESHDLLLQHLGQAMLAFHRTLQHPSINLADHVTTFTASDFGRTLSGNGDGSDHGWGGHHFVMGGAVNGGTVYGMPPQLGNQVHSVMAVSGTAGSYVYGYADTGRGRLIPTISIDQYGATLAKWMGVSDADMPSVFPHINNFDMSAHPNVRVRQAWKKYLDFMV